MVSTHLKNISQLGLLFPIYGKIKNVPNHQSGFVGCHFTLPFPGVAIKLQRDHWDPLGTAASWPSGAGPEPEKPGEITGLKR